MPYVTPEQVAQAKELDLLTYLQTYEPQELVHFSGNTYCTREHDSLKISNGKWHWFSRGIGSKTALDYLIKVKGYTFLQAVERILGQAAVMPPVSRPPPVEVPRKLLLPKASRCATHVVEYLHRRGIDYKIIDYCIQTGRLYESEQYHNAVFVGYDLNGKARYAALRGTIGNYKGEASGSDKRYSFSITENPEATHVHLFESAIDLLSYATLRHMAGLDWTRDSLLSLAGVYQTKRQGVVPVALSRFLEDYPNITTLHLHLDNDEVGRGAATGIMEGLSDRYTVLNEPPRYGKDVNDLLQMQLKAERKKEVSCR